MRSQTVAFVFIAALNLAVAAPAATRQEITVELAAGAYRPATDLLDEELHFGIRMGRWIDERNRFAVSLSTTESSVRDGNGGEVPGIDRRMVLLDVDEAYVFNPSGRVRPLITAGVGWAWASLSGDHAPGGAALLDQDSFTVNGGVGLAMALTPSLSLTPELRGRWFEAREVDSTDLEAALVLGFSF
jgi:hypothetical protein